MPVLHLFSPEHKHYFVSVMRLVNGAVFIVLMADKLKKAIGGFLWLCFPPIEQRLLEG